MTVDIEKYSINREFVHRWFLDKGDGDTNAAISILAQSTMVPCIVIAYWLGEVNGYTPELTRHIDVLTKFYGYTEIKNKPAGAP